MWAVIPVKNLGVAKQRLAPLLTPLERQELLQAMFEDVLAVVMRVHKLEAVAVITACPVATATAKRFGTHVMREAQIRGHTAAIAAAAVALEADGIDGMITLPADVPLVTPDEIDTALAAHEDAPAMSIVPSRDEEGSNCIALSPPTAVPLRFGAGSFHPHLAAARRLGITPQVLKLPGLTLDIDTPNDLKTLCKSVGTTRAQRYLRERGIVERVQSCGRLRSAAHQ
ncbi:MAG: 2-phospho-L-lactate guanylyltransferase [Acidiferrobacterales bacterium]